MISSRAQKTINVRVHINVLFLNVVVIIFDLNRIRPSAQMGNPRVSYFVSDKTNAFDKLTLKRLRLHE